MEEFIFFVESMIHCFWQKLVKKDFPTFFNHCILGIAALMLISPYLVCKVGLSK